MEDHERRKNCLGRRQSSIRYSDPGERSQNGSLPVSIRNIPDGPYILLFGLARNTTCKISTNQKRENLPLVFSYEKTPL